ncbi:MAG TPA: hypothetical protein VF173_04810 [Thermoanaerobaculia bacterium]|nr:hypothetical protein [Thermoanaerobaculia bacterium]
MTISFLTLFFGLISGPFPVEMAVSGPVAAVELRVDGKAAGRLQAPPWKAIVDFGPALAPHQVVARALDAQGHELARAEEWTNLPHPQAKAEIVLEGEKAGPPRAAKVAWTNILGETLESTSLSFDGQALSLDQGGRAVLPAHDLKTIHVLTAEVRFSPDRTVRADVAYGGEYGSEIATELTAVPVRVRSGALPPAEKLAGWFTSGGQPLTVTAVEEGPAQLLVLRVPDTQEIVHRLGSQGTTPLGDVRFEMRLGKEDRVRFIEPYPDRVEGSGQLTDLFGLSPDFSTKNVGVLWLLERMGPAPRLMETRNPDSRRIADAVAVAGLEAMTENRRRAVLLVLNGDEVKDRSRYDAATVRRFLAAIRVPLFVWTLHKPEPGAFAASWGPVQEVAQVKNLYRAMADLQNELRAQRIVLLDGHHLPQSVALGPAAKGVELVETAGAP